MTEQSYYPVTHWCVGECYKCGGDVVEGTFGSRNYTVWRIGHGTQTERNVYVCNDCGSPAEG